MTEWLQLSQGVHIMTYASLYSENTTTTSCKKGSWPVSQHWLYGLCHMHAAVTSMQSWISYIFTCKPHWKMAAMRPPFHLLTYSCVITASCAHDQSERVHTGKLRMYVNCTSQPLLHLKHIVDNWSMQDRESKQYTMYIKRAHKCFCLNDAMQFGYMFFGCKV